MLPRGHTQDAAIPQCDESQEDTAKKLQTAVLSPAYRTLAVGAGAARSFKNAPDTRPELPKPLSAGRAVRTVSHPSEVAWCGRKASPGCNAKTSSVGDCGGLLAPCV